MTSRNKGYKVPSKIVVIAVTIKRSININNPILGANDGGSGVGVLLEIARQIQIKPIDIGVDIIFFDVEDQGEPSGTINSKPNSWCLGSQYWSNNPHVANYFADYGWMELHNDYI